MSTDLQVQPGWLTALRETGKAAFTGLPTQRQEAWKYTGLNKLKALTFEPSPASREVPVRLAQVGGVAAAHRLVFVNGRYAAEYSHIGSLPRGVILVNLANAVNDQPAETELSLGDIIDIAGKPMAALNTAWIEDGLVLMVSRDVALKENVEIVFVATGDAPVAHPRLVVFVGANAEATLIERHLGGAAGGFTNQVAEIDLSNGASFRHYVLHAEPEAAFAVETVVATLARDASYKTFALNAGGGLVRREVEVQLTQPGGFAQVDGAYLVDGDRHTDTTVLIDHRADHCSSRQTQKGIIDDDGRAVYQGKILVRPNAQKTDGYQLSQTLLLSPRAEIDVKPELEIHADDVKCSHGATVGRLDADALFFLRARGIPEAEARALLIQGFIGGALDEIDRADIRDEFEIVAVDWLRRNSEKQS
jgi:Fe-S cluster assembly protein SufD